MKVAKPRRRSRQPEGEGVGHSPSTVRTTSSCPSHRSAPGDGGGEARSIAPGLRDGGSPPCVPPSRVTSSRVTPHHPLPHHPIAHPDPPQPSFLLSCPHFGVLPTPGSLSPPTAVPPLRPSHPGDTPPAPQPRGPGQ